MPGPPTGQIIPANKTEKVKFGEGPGATARQNSGHFGRSQPKRDRLGDGKTVCSHGAKVAILDLDLNAAHEAAALLGDGHLGLRCDVTDAEACNSSAAKVIENFGGIDILVNNAGITQPVKTLEIDAKSWQRIR